MEYIFQNHLIFEKKIQYKEIIFKMTSFILDKRKGKYRKSAVMIYITQMTNVKVKNVNTFFSANIYLVFFSCFIPGYDFLKKTISSWVEIVM